MISQMKLAFRFKHKTYVSLITLCAQNQMRITYMNVKTKHATLANILKQNVF